ncbi:unnamed protein product [Closterium sp. NIES-64]|nr:unnamed protein product [Closterium sp. NIES-64]CAI5955279.1 unnamed protein product [Closterium sp. NIES-64]CAI5956803.1 unnamed protein product [Closterium sp. NIES-64]
MHERKLKGHKQRTTYADGVKLCRQFARVCVDNLNDRLDDLGKLGATKLFRAGKWPKIKAQREKKCKEWLHGCSRLFRHKLPGFDLKAAERERKGKQKDDEAVAAGTAGENEDEGEEEEDDEVEHDLGNDQEIVEEEDNPFLSADEDVEEVYFIDKPVH